MCEDVVQRRHDPPRKKRGTRSELIDCSFFPFSETAGSVFSLSLFLWCGRAQRKNLTVLRQGHRGPIETTRLFSLMLAGCWPVQKFPGKCQDQAFDPR